jgi:hypothetical protein
MAAYHFSFRRADDAVTGEEIERFGSDEKAIQHARALLGHHEVVVVSRDTRFIARVSRSSGAQGSDSFHEI